MKKLSRWLVILCLSLNLFACGGGDDDGGSSGGGSDGGSDSSSSAKSDESSSSPSPSNLSSSGTIEELVIARDNNLSSTYQLTVDVSLTQLAGKEAYIVVCEHSSDTIDYDKCFVKASLDNGVGVFELLLPNHQQSLITEVTPMEANSVALTFTWQYDNQAQSTWLIP